MSSGRRRLCVIGLAVLALAVVAAPAAAAPSGGAPSGGAPSGGAPSAAGVQVVMTSANLSWRLSRLPDLTFATDRPSGLPVVTVDDDIRYQRFTGVGAAMTDSSAWLIYDELSTGTRARLMNALFGASGIHLNFVRFLFNDSAST